MSVATILRESCILSKFYIKPQQNERDSARIQRCILSKFYIKPQLGVAFVVILSVVSYRNSTSNHNDVRSNPLAVPLYLIEILHQTTTPAMVSPSYRCCILSKFYIKPQLRPCRCPGPCVVSYRNSTSNHNLIIQIIRCDAVVSYRNSTSNHNSSTGKKKFLLLYLIEILHQTTTLEAFFSACCELYLIEILHQTTTSFASSRYLPVLYLIEILHQTTTSRPCCRRSGPLYLIEILHQTTTPFLGASSAVCCILSKFYIKPQQPAEPSWMQLGCILSKFYIKPQHLPGYHLCRSGCILSKFYIKPQLTNNQPSANGVVSYRNSTSNHNVGPHID